MNVANYNLSQQIIVKNFGLTEYKDTCQKMLAFTHARNEATKDELWLVEHKPIFTLGQAGKEEHILHLTDIPIIKCDRGGQVTYHGPGQLVAYPLLDIRRKGLTIKQLVNGLEETIISLLQNYRINSQRKCNAPGVYCEDKKIASLGLRIHKGRSYHGVSFNVAMDLSPFSQINPCGYKGQEVTSLQKLLSKKPENNFFKEVQLNFVNCFTNIFKYINN